RDASGDVAFSADVRILRPSDPAKANRRLVLDVVNRGNPVAIRHTDFGPRLPESASECWLLQQGYTVVSCGWHHNVPPGTEPLDHGAPLAGQGRGVLQVNARRPLVGVADEPWPAVHIAYPVADLDDPTASLTELDDPLGPKRVIPRDQWRFQSDGTHVALDG